MVKKVSKGGSARTSAPRSSAASPLAGAIKESAQQIWLAGLGAFSKAQEEGGKAFETLVKEGMSIQRKTQAVAEERISEATSRVSTMANELQNKAAGQWDKLESLFEERVAKALGKLGVPSARDVDALMERIDALNEQVLKLGGVPVSATKVARKPAPRKTAAKRAPAKKAVARKAAAKKAA